MFLGKVFGKKEKTTPEKTEVVSDEKKTRTLSVPLDRAVTVAMIALGLYHIYVGFFGARSAMELRSIHWLIISVCIFLIYPARKKSIGKVTVPDYAWAAAAFASGSYILFNWERIAVNGGATVTMDIVMGCISIVVVLEAARRAIGPVLASLSGLFLLYAFFGHLIPGTLGHREYSLSRIVAFLYTGTEGIYGTAMNTSAKYVALFVLFGAMLEKFGGGELFVDLAYSLTGKRRGGPAKAAVVSSALMGTMSGSAVANVVTTGAFTIPLMKKNGYKPQVAGAIEAVASTGGQIMPPVMGAAAFLMAEMTGIAYSDIMRAALIPALFYFFAIYMMVDLEAIKENIPVAKDADIKPIRGILKRGGYLLIPLIILIVMVFSGKSAILSASYSIAAILILDLLFGTERKLILKKFLFALNKGMRSVISVCGACAAAGIVVGVIQLTGIGSKFSSLMLSIAGDNVLIALVLTMVASLIMGCGLPTTAAYIVLATLAVPALTEIGVPLLAAHLFVLYFGSISTITPPVALSSYAGAAIAGANPNTVGFVAFRFGILAFIVPYMFVYSPQLLMEGAALEVLYGMFTGLVGVVGIAVAMQGFWKTKCTLIERAAALVGGMLMVVYGTVTDFIGLALLAAVFAIQFMRVKKQKAEVSHEAV